MNKETRLCVAKRRALSLLLSLFALLVPPLQAHAQCELRPFRLGSLFGGGNFVIEKNVGANQLGSAVHFIFLFEPNEDITEVKVRVIMDLLSLQQSLPELVSPYIPSSKCRERFIDHSYTMIDPQNDGTAFGQFSVRYENWTCEANDNFKNKNFQKTIDMYVTLVPAVNTNNNALKVSAVAEPRRENASGDFAFLGGLVGGLEGTLIGLAIAKTIDEQLKDIKFTDSFLVLSGNEKLFDENIKRLNLRIDNARFANLCSRRCRGLPDPWLGLIVEYRGRTTTNKACYLRNRYLPNLAQEKFGQERGKFLSPDELKKLLNRNLRGSRSSQ